MVALLKQLEILLWQIPLYIISTGKIMAAACYYRHHFSYGDVWETASLSLCLPTERLREKKLEKDSNLYLLPVPSVERIFGFLHCPSQLALTPLSHLCLAPQIPHGLWVGTGSSSHSVCRKFFPFPQLRGDRFSKCFLGIPLTPWTYLFYHSTGKALWLFPSEILPPG